MSIPSQSPDIPVENASTEENALKLISKASLKKVSVTEKKKENMALLAASLPENLEDDRIQPGTSLRPSASPSSKAIRRVIKSFCGYVVVTTGNHGSASSTGLGIAATMSCCPKLCLNVLSVKIPATPSLRKHTTPTFIMYGIVPDIDTEKPETLPYCDWYTDVASEQTYREVARRYPQMMYQVARACAVAGYDTLYQELDILPEVAVAVAEEARASVTAEQSKIYRLVMKSPVRYSVMDGYERRIIPDPQQGFLNADTATIAKLKAAIPYQAVTWYLGDPMVFDLLEVGDFASKASQTTETHPLATSTNDCSTCHC